MAVIGRQRVPLLRLRDPELGADANTELLQTAAQEVPGQVRHSQYITVHILSYHVEELCVLLGQGSA